MKILIYIMLISGISPLHSILPGFEHFPYGLLIIFLCIRVNIYALLTLLLMLGFYLASVYHYYGNSSFDLRVTLGIVQMINFISPLFFFRGNEQLIARAANHVFWAYIIVGLMQMAHLLVLFESFIQFFIARFHGGPIGGYRGVTMLETEPARAAFQLFMLYVISTTLNRRYFHQKTAALILSLFVLNGSTTGIFIAVVYFGCLFVPRISLFRLAAVGGAIFSVIFFFGITNPKVALLIDFYRTGGVQGIYTALSAVSGGRFLATVETILNILRWPLGYGANPSFLLSEKIELASQVKGYNTRVSARPVSAILNFLYYFGFFMLIPVWRAIRSNVGSGPFGMQAVALIIIGIIYTPPGSEAWMIAFCMVLFQQARTSERDALETPFQTGKSYKHVPSGGLQ